MPVCEGPRAEGQDSHRQNSESALRNFTLVWKSTIWEGGASAPEAAPSDQGRAFLIRPAINIPLNALDLTAGTLRRFSFRAPARFHFRPSHNFAAALRSLAPCVASSPRHLPPPRRRPTQLVCLPSPRYSQRIRRNIFGYRGPGRDVRSVANPHRRHQRAITADKNAIAD